MRNRVGSRQMAEGRAIAACGLAFPLRARCIGAPSAKPQAAKSFIPHSAFRTPHSAITLIELLIVVVIMTTLVAAAIPLMSPASDARRIREAARGLNTYITSAQSRAINTGRPHGIVLKKLSSDTGSAADNGVCLEVFQCEQPPPFAGFDERARVRISLDPENDPNKDGNFDDGGLRIQFVRLQSPDTFAGDALPVGLDYDPIPPGIFRRGDVIEVAGKRYEFTDPEAQQKLDASGFYISESGEPDGELFIRALDPRAGQHMNFAFKDLSTSNNRKYLHWTPPLPYKILRQPMITSTEPYQLPEGTAIDLRASGDQERSFHYPKGEVGIPAATDNGDPIYVLFTPEGSVERVRFNSYLNANDSDNQTQTAKWIDSPTTYDLFLLIGLRENVPLTDPDAIFDFNILSSAAEEELEEQKAKYNWLNLDSRWVVIGPQSGNVVTVENAFVNPVQVAALSGTLFDKRNAEIIRAREFAREMTRTGGR